MVAHNVRSLHFPPPRFLLHTPTCRKSAQRAILMHNVNLRFENVLLRTMHVSILRSTCYTRGSQASAFACALQRGAPVRCGSGSDGGWRLTRLNDRLDQYHSAQVDDAKATLLSCCDSQPNRAIRDSLMAIGASPEALTQWAAAEGDDSVGQRTGTLRGTFARAGAVPMGEPGVVRLSLEGKRSSHTGKCLGCKWNCRIVLETSLMM